MDHTTKGAMYKLVHEWLGTSLLTSDGERWHSRRRLITPTFHFEILQDFCDVMNEKTDIFLDILDAKVASLRAAQAANNQSGTFYGIKFFLWGSGHACS